jgi:hypothetical protein
MQSEVMLEKYDYIIHQENNMSLEQLELAFLAIPVLQ